MNDEARITRMASLKTAKEFTAHLKGIGVELGFDETLAGAGESPLARPIRVCGREVGNRFCALPMEGWDGTRDGRPSELTRRRWRNFGVSGCKLIWGGEAAAVRPDGRANPNQLLIDESTLGDLEALRQEMMSAHREHFSRSDDVLVGLQLTHSGRYARPEPGGLQPRVLYRHPFLDARSNVTSDTVILSDDDLARLTEEFIEAGRLAAKIGFDFVDVKHCHGYLGHEFLSAVDRPGKYGGSLENRTRFLRDVTSGLRSAAPGLEIGVRVSIFDFPPFVPGTGRIGEPASRGPYRFAFGADSQDPLKINLAEPIAFLNILRILKIQLVCLTAGSPYYNPHIQRPAMFPPSDGYLPPEDPLAGVARQIEVTGRLKKMFPDLAIVGSGYSYLQEWLPNVAQHVVGRGMADFVGLGRMMLAYPELAADVLAERPMQAKRLCRTFSDCTTGPRNGLVSGCFPLDPFYREHGDYEKLRTAKRKNKEA